MQELNQIRKQGQVQQILWAFARATSHISLARKGGESVWNA
jgi:hypothetical protein